MVGKEPDFFSQLHVFPGARYPVLFTESLYKYLSINGPRDCGWRSPASADATSVPAKSLRATVDRQTAVSRLAHHRTQNRKRQLFFLRDAVIQLHKVIKNVIARAYLRDPGHFSDPFARRRTAGCDLADLDTACPKTICYFHQQSSFGMPGISRVRRSRKRARPKRRYPSKSQTRQRLYCDRQSRDRLLVFPRDSSPMQSAINIDLDIDRNPSFSRRLRQPPRSFFTVAVHRHAPCSRSQRGNALPLRLADNRICNADILDSRCRERLSLAYLGTDDPTCTGCQLHASDLGDLVRLDVRTKPDSAPIGVGLPLSNILLQPIQVNERHWSVQIADE